MKPIVGKIVPRNLTAQAAYLVPGNPTISRPEDAVANCYPGLELDVRNLDRRFFPGLVFDFVARNDVDAAYVEPWIYGAKLLYVDAEQDPDLRTESDWAQKLFTLLTGDGGTTLGEGTWYLEWIEQDGRRLSMCARRDPNGVENLPFDGLFVWRLVRSLDPGDLVLKIGLRRRDQPASLIELEGRRRQYTDPETGALNGAYQPGELMQSLCSPWQHDFQECLCHYWASNHPDVVYAEVLPGERTLPGGAAQDPVQANTRLDWLRASRSRTLSATALNTTPANRPFRVDQHEINRRWQELSVVIDGREIGSRYVPPDFEVAKVLGSPGEVAAKVGELAKLEMALAIEYLYARFSLLSPKEAQEATAAGKGWPTLAEDVTFVRQELLLIAVSEMQHLRWANQLLWEFQESRLTTGFQPVLSQADKIPAGERSHDHSLRRLERDVLDEFIAAEHPSSRIDGAYAGIIATLRQSPKDYPPHAIELVERIIIDGMQHESRLLNIKARLQTYAEANPPYPYLRPLKVGRSGRVAAACGLFDGILEKLRLAYTTDSTVSADHLTQARLAMNALLEEGDNLAAKGIGIPFMMGQSGRPSPGKRAARRRGRR